MNEEERLWVMGYGLRDRRFTRLWTQKEAVVKAIGTGIVSFEQLQTILDNGQWALETFETEKYIYSIAYGKLHCIGAEVQASDL
jgi:phosphopantetheinyl transferase